MPKKQPRNAFYFYMLDYKEEEESRGVRFPNGMRDVAVAAAEDWKNLPKDERAPYETMAKNEKLKRKDDMTQKFTPNGETFADIMAQQKEAEMVVEREKAAVKNMIKLKTWSTSAIIDHVFYVIDVNYYCKKNDNYVPCEIGMVKFSLKKGIIEEYHRIVNPEGGIPLGFASDAMDSIKVHGIPLPPDAGNPDEYIEILSCIYDFMDCTMDEDKSALPPVFTMPKRVEAVQSVLRQICDSTRRELHFSVYCIDFMFFTLKNAIKRNESEGFPKPTLAHVELEKHNFEYYPELSCSFHKDLDMFHNCVLNRTKNWSYIILDHCCQIVDVELEPGRHMPNNIDAHGTEKMREKAGSRAPSAMSVNAWQSDNTPRATPRPTTSQGGYLTRSTREPNVEVFAGIPQKMYVGRGRPVKSINDSMKNIKIGDAE